MTSHSSRRVPVAIVDARRRNRECPSKRREFVYRVLTHVKPGAYLDDAPPPFRSPTGIPLKFPAFLFMQIKSKSLSGAYEKRTLGKLTIFQSRPLQYFRWIFDKYAHKSL